MKSTTVNNDNSLYFDKRKCFEILKELYSIDNKRKYPNLPESVRSIPTFTDKTANGLTQCIITFIRLIGGQAERINCTGRMIDKRQTVTDVIGRVRTIGSCKYIPTSGQRGTADISTTIKGLSVKIEVKIGNDRQSEAQRQYQKSIEQSGGLYVIAKDFTGFFNWYQLKFDTYGK